jgi:cardiolipin synthase
MPNDLLVIAIFLYSVIVIVTLVSEERDPSTTLAWILILLLIPVVGIALYLLFGRDQRSSGARDPRRVAATGFAMRVLEPIRLSFAESAGITDDPLYHRVSTAITRLNGTVPMPCDGLEIFTGGDEKFARLLADIEAARHFVHLQYFIWGSDELTARICEALAAKVREGVEVRVLYDWVGSALHSKRQLKMLTSAGALVRPDRADWSKLNYRNHRKVAVIDGDIAYTGGMNMGREYADGGHRFETWRDTHIRFAGPLVRDLQALFCARWYRVTGEDLFAGRYFPEPPAATPGGERVWAQLAFSGPESEWQALRHVFHVAIAHANDKVRVQSPYFVPDQSIGDVLTVQSFAGVDVRLMMAGVHDKRLPWWAAFSYLDELVYAGGRALQYQAGFLHAKTLTIDGRLAAVGTANFDNRSFALHDELQIFFFDENVTARFDRLFDEDVTRCRELTAEALVAIGRLARFRNAMARLLSRGM